MRVRPNTVEIGASHSLLLLWVCSDPSNKEATTRMTQGHCTLPPDNAGRILDRLAGLEQVISPAAIRSA